MLTAGRDLTLLGRRFGPGEAIPESVWLSPRMPERNRRAMVRNRWVRSPELTPDKATLRARKQGITEAVTVSPAPAAEGFACGVCDRAFTSKSALGGHMRGHAKRGEA